jgi:CheY-like chemotaxis protein
MEIKQGPKVFSTFEAGRVCGVVHTTVINWVNKGLLKAHTTPGGHRRIALADLVDFMRRFEMPIPEDLSGRRRRILVAEDDPAVQRMLRRALSALEGVEVEACASGLEALISIGREAPDLLVLDIRIPQVNGFEVLKVLRANAQTRPVRIVVVTGEALPREDEAVLRRDADAFFRKPVELAAFRRRAAELLELDPVPAGD